MRNMTYSEAYELKGSSCKNLFGFQIWHEASYYSLKGILVDRGVSHPPPPPSLAHFQQFADSFPSPLVHSYSWVKERTRCLAKVYSTNHGLYLHSRIISQSRIVIFCVCGNIILSSTEDVWDTVENKRVISVQNITRPAESFLRIVVRSLFNPHTSLKRGDINSCSFYPAAILDKGYVGLKGKRYKTDSTKFRM